MAVFQLPTDGIADGAITTAKINASVSLGASVNVILDGTDGGGSNGSLHGLTSFSLSPDVPKSQFFLEYIARPQTAEIFFEDVLMAIVF